MDNKNKKNDRLKKYRLKMLAKGRVQTALFVPIELMDKAKEFSYRQGKILQDGLVLLLEAGLKSAWVDVENKVSRPPLKGIGKSIVYAISHGITHRKDIANKLGKSINNIATNLSRLVKKNFIRPIGNGHYELVDDDILNQISD